MFNDNQQEAVIKEAGEFIRKYITPFATDYENDRMIPREIITKLAEKGYLAANFPVKYGGLGLDPVYYGLFTEELGKGCNSIRELITVHSALVGETLLRWGSEQQKTFWLNAMASGRKIAAFALTEPEVGSDAKSVKTNYTKKGNNYVLNGLKKWITFGDIADVFIVIATDVTEISAFIVERNLPGVITTPMKGLLAGGASHIAELSMNDVMVDSSCIIGMEGAGFTYIVNTAMDHGRYSIAWAGVALAQAAIECMVSYSRSRSQFGQKLYNFQLIQGMIGNAVTKVHAARALCLKAGEMRKNNHQDAVTETTIAKHFSSRIAMEIAIDAVQVHGGNGCSNVYPVERIFREAKILEIIEGTSQIQQEIIAKYALKRYFGDNVGRSVNPLVG